MRRGPRWWPTLLVLGVVVLLVLSAARSWREVRPFLGVDVVRGEDGVFIERVVPGSPAERAGLRPGDRIEEIAGTPVSAWLAAQDRLAGAEPGRPLGLVIERYGQRLPATVSVGAVVEWHGDRILAASVALLFLLGAVAVLLRPRYRRASLVYALWCMAGALVLGVSWSTRAETADWLLFWVDRAARLVFPALWIHLVLSLRSARSSWRRWLPVIYAPAATLLVAEVHLVGFSGALRAEDPVGLVDLLQSRIEIGWIGGGLLAGVLVLALQARRTSRAEQKAQARWLLFGAAAAVLPFAALTWLPRLLGGVEPSWSWIALPLMGLAPALLTRAVMEYRLMDLALFGRRAVAGGLMLGLTVVLFLGLFSLARVLVPFVLVPAGIVPVLLAAVGTAALAPAVRAGVRDLVGRLFYRRRYSFRKALERVARELNAEQHLPRLAEVLERRIGEALDADPVRLLLLTDKARPVEPATGRPVAARIDAPLRRRLEEGEVVTLADLPDAPENLPSLHLAGVQVLVPLRVEGRVIALLAVGPRRHGVLLDSDDLDLLRTVAAHAAAAVAGAQHLGRLREQVTLVERLKSRTEALVEASPIAIVMIDQEGLVRHWNQAAERLLEKRRDDVLERSYVDVLPPALHEQVRQTLYTLSRTRRSFRVRVGQGRLVNLTCSPLGAPSALDGLLLTLDDVTEQVRMEEQLIQQDRLASVGMLAAGVAHEVNTPLTGISSYAQILLEETPAEDPRRPLLEKVVTQADRASRIARGLLSLSRPGGEGALALGPVDLMDLAEETVGLIAPQVRRAGATVTCERPPRPVVAEGDRSRLQQVVMNLLLNALDAVGEGGEITLRAWQERDGMARLEVRDNGVGIPAEARDRIFDPFFTTKDAGAGTGLGLSISYAIVREHAGTLAVDSEPGEGTAVRMLLPLAAVSADRRAV
ncbi:MAG: ATP-binding protein [Acidobacteriota bacterium]|nr:ATP-binding protein [Acidobacteriota bacterium]